MFRKHAGLVDLHKVRGLAKVRRLAQGLVDLISVRKHAQG